jgi:LytS/YehU family sensor histidine kinase
VRHGAALGLIALTLSPVVSLAYLAIIYHTYFPYRDLLPTFGAMVRSDLATAIHNDLMTCLVLGGALHGWRVWEALQHERMRSSELERQLAVAKLDALRMQLHPHFLFNTLHTVTGLIGQDPPTARRMVIALGDLLRVTLQDGTAPFQSLAKELAFVDLYMDIQRLRLGDRVNLDYDIDPEATAATVPHLLLQPLFENAVRHGASRLAGRCDIVFRAQREDGRLHLSLANDAPPGAPEHRDRRGVGLANTLDRLRLHYGSDFTFEYIERPQGGVRIDIAMPYRAAEESSDAIPPSAARAAG